jgi:UDP-glucose 4-epimerase
MRVLITGGAGFIGSHLCDELLARGDRVHALDDLSTGSIDNIRHLRDVPAFGYTIDSAGDSRLVAELVDEADFVFHLAAAVGVHLVIESPVSAIETNVHCTEIVLAQASKKKKPVFVASTSEVYGKSEAVPYREDGDLLLGSTDRGRWAYACSKAIDEFLSIAHWKERKLPVIVGRLFNTVGPRQTGRYGMVVPRFVAQALSNEPITVFGDGQQRRCFCHVEDTVRALADLMHCEAAYGQVFNIGAQQEVRIVDLAKRVRELARSRSEIVFVPYDEAYEEGFEDMPRRVPDTTRLREEIGWETTRDLDGIIEDVIEAKRGGVGEVAGGKPGLGVGADVQGPR